MCLYKHEKCLKSHGEVLDEGCHALALLDRQFGALNGPDYFGLIV